MAATPPSSLFDFLVAFLVFIISGEKMSDRPTFKQYLTICNVLDVQIDSKVTKI